MVLQLLHASREKSKIGEFIGHLRRKGGIDTSDGETLVASDTDGNLIVQNQGCVGEDGIVLPISSIDRRGGEVEGQGKGFINRLLKLEETICKLLLS